ncbi:hypothetical protein RHSIM_Rhsim02G0060400 [Rhododendron simsii]|uniref:Uncharacterized protein n=1 Tax=Rhododendron simsii TaxID=118357 RepID=A0A834HAY5_RHOSS|nr:hypothetical protein RHSIM_Rhsim02G0060400 [Rhododendron simsii]
MATTRALLLRPQQTLTLIQTHFLRSLSTSPPNHQFLSANDFLNSWTAHTDPKQAQAKLALLRREYAKKVKAYRKEYIEEVELERIEKQRKDEAKREAMRIANEERRAAKVASKKAKAAEREVAEEEFRQTLVKSRVKFNSTSHCNICFGTQLRAANWEEKKFRKCKVAGALGENCRLRDKPPSSINYGALKERTQKLEYWRLKEKHIEEKKKEKKELLRRKSSMWVDEAELEKTILEVIVDTKPL